MIRFLPYENNSMKAFDGDLESGICTFEIDGYKMQISFLEATDNIVAEGLIRSSLNFGANRGAYIAQTNGVFFNDVFKRLGFKGNEKLSAEIPEVLTGGCSCSHNNKITEM